ncbi:spore germination protein [Paenibacillus sp. y28]|uniref:spore germination protein n=1 Tax=Paenibacillus sp. y28 TaxID=3129110 RepID=UPI00301B4896
MTGNRAHAETESAISKQMENNLLWLEKIFDRCHDVAFEPFRFGPELAHSAFAVYCRSLVKNSHNEFVEDVLQQLAGRQPGAVEAVSIEQVIHFLSSHGAASQPFYRLSSLQGVENAVWLGHVVILFQGWDQAIAYKAAEFEKRQVTEPTSEPVVQGPREGTVESLSVNLGMIRQRVKSSRLKMEFIRAGSVMKTNIVYAYLDQAVDQEVLREFRSRIGDIDTYEVLDTSYVEDWIQDSNYSPFPQHRITERTDTAAAALLDGKILILVENSPMILICPAVFVDFFNTSEDYYVRTMYAILIRQLRLVAFFIALTLPSIYIALSTFHPELIPTVLLLAILDTREDIPFPAFFEALIMEVSFELLREAGIRLPRPVGSAVSIVGALVIGQAAIMAKIASPTMVIIVAFTGIASFAIPHYDMAIAIRVLRFPFMIASGMLGGYGLMLGFLLTLLHLTSLHTLGVPFLSSLAPLCIQDLRDVFIRAPLKTFLRIPRNRRLHRSGHNQ